MELNRPTTSRANDGAPQRVLFMPDWADLNPYQNILVQALQGAGLAVELADFPGGCFQLNRTLGRQRGLHVLHLHWADPLIAPLLWARTPFVRYLKLALLLIDILIVRLRGVAVVWTIHNLLAHESPDRKAELQALRWLARSCSRIVVHGPHALERVQATYRLDLSRKASIVPHPNYDGCYPLRVDHLANLRARIDPDGGHTVILFFGAIRPYKGVHRLLQAFRATPGGRLRLVIAGNPSTPAFGQELVALAASDPRIVLMLGYVPADQVAALFTVADVVALPLEASLTSGSVVLALTQGRPLLLPEEDRALDVVDDATALFFDSDAGLARQLARLDKDRLASMGAAARRTAEGFSHGRIAALSIRVYRAAKCITTADSESFNSGDTRPPLLRHSSSQERPLEKFPARQRFQAPPQCDEPPRTTATSFAGTTAETQEGLLK